MSANGPPPRRSRISGLLAEADAARRRFLAALDDVDPAMATTPGIVGEWSARDLVAHVAWWCDHGSDALDLATSGLGDTFSYSTDDTDAMNAAALAGWQRLTMARARTEEERAFRRFRERIEALDPE